MKKTAAWVYVSVLLPSISFLLLTIFAPATEVIQFGLSPRVLLFARLLAGVVFVVTWVSGAACIIALSRILPDVDEPRRTGLRRLSDGILLLLVGTMLATNVTAIRAFFLGDPHVAAALTILYNALFVVPQLAAFWCVFSAAGKLQDSTAPRAGAGWRAFAAAGFLLFSGLYLGLIFTNGARTLPASLGQLADYYLPDVLIVLTVVLPFLVGIALAIGAAFRFSRQSLTFVEGSSRSSADRIAHAVLVIMLSLVFLQGFFILGSKRLATFGPTPISALVFAFLFMQMAGFIMLLRAIRKIDRVIHAVPSDVYLLASPPKKAAAQLPGVTLPMAKVWPYAIVLALAASYLVLTFLAPRSGDVLQFGLTPQQLFLVRLTANVAYLVSWLAGTHAVLTLFAVAKASDSSKASAFRYLGAGFLCLMLGLVAAVHASALSSIFLQDEGLAALLTIILNYCFVFPPLAGFGLIYLGSGRLRQKAGIRDVSALSKVAAGIVLAALAAGYIWLVFTGPSREFPPSPSALAIYYLPDTAIALSIVLPVLIGFVLATAALFRITRYYVNLGGLYRPAADRIVAADLLILITSGFLQVFHALGSARLAAIGLIFTLIIIEANLLMQMFGYLMLARSIRQIAASEERAEKFIATHDVEAKASGRLSGPIFD